MLVERVVYRSSDRAFPLNVSLVPYQHILKALQRNDVLAVINFSDETKIDVVDTRLISIGMEILGDDNLAEVWYGREPVTFHRQGRITFSKNREVLFGHILIDKADSIDLSDAVEDAYKDINEFALTSEYPNIFRFWHYIPDINRAEKGLQRYKIFCAGRYAALDRKTDFKKNLPAATAIGTDVTGLLISFLATRAKLTQMENPRQVSAFNYPPIHGPKRPLFSRAVCMGSQSEYQLFLSGVASIVGHESKHMNDPVAQTEEICRNIDAILDKLYGYLYRSSRKERIAASSLRVYLRRPEQLNVVQEVLKDYLYSTEPVIYIKGDICRSELLLEIEGIFVIPCESVCR